MKNRFVLFIALCFLLFLPAICLAAGPVLLEKSLADSRSQKYYLQLPSRYDGLKKYPLFIAIHWLDGTAMQQINEWKFLAQKNGYILLCPQFNAGYQRLAGGQGKKLLRIIAEVEKDYSVDKERIFLIGFSGGAQFALRFAYKNHFLKAVCVLSLGDFDPPPSGQSAKAVKYFLGVGEKDSRYRLMGELYNLLKKKGYNVVFEAFPLVGHFLHPAIKDAVMRYISKI